jgi:hypothetical protein
MQDIEIKSGIFAGEGIIVEGGKITSLRISPGDAPFFGPI